MMEHITACKYCHGRQVFQNDVLVEDHCECQKGCSDCEFGESDVQCDCFMFDD